MIRRVDHVGIIVHDVEAASTLWIERLGLEWAGSSDVLDGSVRLAYLDIGDTTLQLVQPLKPGELADYLQEHGEGLHHVCFEVGDISAALESLGETPRLPPYQGGRGADVCFITTMPCGVLTELTEPTPDHHEFAHHGDEAARSQ